MLQLRIRCAFRQRGPEDVVGVLKLSAAALFRRPRMTVGQDEWFAIEQI